MFNSILTYRKLIKVTLLSASIIGIGFLLFHFYIPRLITEIQNPILFLSKPANIKNNPILKDNQENIIRLTSYDNLNLVAEENLAKTDTTKATIILLHGIRLNKGQFKKISTYLNEQGFNTVSLDLRAHGGSEGRHCTFSVKEKYDIRLLLDHLEKRYNFDMKYGIWGQSLGGAIALTSLENDERLQFGVIESSFTDFRTIVHDYSKFHLGFDIPVLTNYLVDRAGKIADFLSENARPINSCKRIRQPVLITHGNQDERIKIEYGEMNFNTLQNKNSAFLSIDGANHLNVWAIGGQKYIDSVINFMNKNL